MDELNCCQCGNADLEVTPEGDWHEVVCHECGKWAQGHTFEDAVNAWNNSEFVYD